LPLLSSHRAQQLRPQIFVTYNGDFFDWPFMHGRAEACGISMEREIGVRENNGEWRGRNCVHMDCMYWVKRDSYLPQVPCCRSRCMSFSAPSRALSLSLSLSLYLSISLSLPTSFSRARSPVSSGRECSCFRCRALTD
jgi:hypothetical protein